LEDEPQLLHDPADTPPKAKLANKAPIYNDNLNTEEINDDDRSNLLFRPSSTKASAKKKRPSVSSKMNFVHPAHQNFNMVLNIMIGIKKSVDSSLEIPMY